MITSPLLIRITDCLQRQHDLNVELTDLAAELTEHAKRSADMTARLMTNMKGGGSEVIDFTKAPRILQGGPVKRGEAHDWLPSDNAPVTA